MMRDWLDQQADIESYRAATATTGTREALGDIASRFPILPTRLADALNTFGSDTYAWVWIVDGKLLKLEVETP